MYLQC